MMILYYRSKRQLKEAIGTRLKYKETSIHGNEYKSNGTFVGSNRPSISGTGGKEFYAEITMKDDRIAKVK